MFEMDMCLITIQLIESIRELVTKVGDRMVAVR